MLKERLSGMKAYKTKAKKRIPTFGIRPGLEIGCKVTVRKDKEKLLKRLLASVNNQIRMKKIQDNHFSFGIDEYIEIPGIEYQRDIGILGLDVTVVFARKGKRVKIRKIKKGKLPRKQNVSKEEIKEFLIKKFDVEVI